MSLVAIVDHDDIGAQRALDLVSVPLKRIQLGLDDMATEVEVRDSGFCLEQGDTVLTDADMASAATVLYRRWRMKDAPLVRSTVDGEAERQFAEREWTALIEAILFSSERREAGIRWVNRPSRSMIAASKLHLLGVAREQKFQVPPWVAATRFAAPEDSPELIGKAINPDQAVDEVRRFATAEIPPELASRLAGTRAPSPSLVQRKVLVGHELRVFACCGRTFALRLTAKEKYADIRLLTRDSLAISPEACPPELEAHVLGLMHELQLEFSAFDFLATESGLHLIDITPNGSWDWYESPAEPVVSAFIADALVASTSTT